MQFVIEINKHLNKTEKSNELSFFRRCLVISSLGMLLFYSCKKDKIENVPASSLPAPAFQYLNSSNSNLLSDSINALFPFNNQLFVCTAKGLSVYTSSGFINYTTHNSGLPSDYVNCCFITDSVWWVGTNAGLVKYSVTFQQWQVFNISNSSLPNNKIRSIRMDKYGKVWVGTFTGGGVASYDGVNWQVFTPSNSPLPSSSIARIFIQDSLYWFGTGGGLARYNGNKWTIYTPGNSGLQSAWIYDIIEGANASLLFIATNNGINTFNLINNSWTYYNSTNSGLTGNFTRKLSYDKTKNMLWIATDGNGLFKSDGNQFTQYKYTGAGSLPSNYLTDVCLFNGKLWVATKENGLAIMQ
ncbi:MAG: hypothetical protein KatS3mg027_1640 [Bacteroidia bacterium]|nr:MAG: hypothetical protein KatS3mg027_1640 [Bacteroidia bacterium]